jgi:hypothetical protein
LIPERSTRTTKPTDWRAFLFAVDKPAIAIVVSTTSYISQWRHPG